MSIHERIELGKKRFTPDRYTLWLAGSNNTDYIILEEIGSYRHVVVDWDVSDDDIEIIVEMFEGCDLGYYDFAETIENIEWSEDDFRRLYDIISTTVKQIG